LPTLYDISVPAFIRGLSNMAAFLEKGRAYAAEQGWAESALTEARLYEDMAPLTSQIQRASDSAKFVAVRVGGVENKSFADEEVTFADLQQRIAATIEFLKAAPREGFDGKDDAEVIVKTPSRDIRFTARDYVIGFALPNFYFHETVAYALLRSKGVPVGKMDFLGGV